MKPIHILVAAISSLSATISSAQPILRYQLSVESALPNQVQVAVNTSAFSNITVQPARTSMADSTQPELFCQKSSGLLSPLHYAKNSECDSIHWSLKLNSADDLGMDVSQQEDTYHPQKQWYFVSEFNSLPRVFIDDSNPIETSVCLPNGKCEALPLETEPPLLLVWGQESTSIDIQGHHVVIQSDTPQVMENLNRWKPTLADQLQYLTNVFQNTDTRDWQIAFFSRETESGSVGGAAGHNQILVNAPIHKGKLSDQSLGMMLKIAAHESVHKLESPGLPLWASESLAEYYANKSLRGTRFPAKSPLASWQSFSQTFPFANTGLLEANRRVSEHNEYQYYPLFYVKGTAFWWKLDRLLEKYHASLDAFVGDLSFDSEDQISQAFISKVTTIIGIENWKTLAELYF
ncbi:conserved hypothetical protein [Vibrio nigripulchritudo MADA3029]|uniref:hypothetical protein n=1 Tax=Vibrio nigripulchritudo TaxID=28173 RepID=UPI0003B1FFE1|nr:hypothetical protein [Vibrio nigripulchritudo]CCN50257.1 conserved hypothetical protein [Vibrio nigripulchritudo MADA3020]CCN53316.1 conserved hypothetical protein [Vibrio nigripulchritudo MADA3021]CCN60195.1 conserved hypothetical protein [Vibrio nigripulchritudo MADA3029]